STVRAAQARAENIREQARQEAGRITAEADEYVAQLLSRLEQQLVRNLNEVRNGITVIRDASTVVAEPVEEEAAELVEFPTSVNSEQYVEVDFDYQDSDHHS